MPRLLALALLASLLPASALAGERVLTFRTAEDAAYPADMALCNAFFGSAPERQRVVLGAGVWSYRTRASDGTVVNESARFLGTATGCGIMTSPVPFTPAQAFTIRFDLDDGTYVATGTCDIVSVDVPQRGLLLAGCALRLVAMPDGVLGGIAASTSVFNPAQLPGYGTGSIWTMHLYTTD